MLKRRPIIVDGIKLDRKQAAGVYKAAYAAARRPRRILGWMTIALLCAPVVIAWWLMGGAMFRSPAGVGPFAIAILLGGLSGGYFGLCINFGSRWIYRREIRRSMLDLGYRLCEGCGYWLKGLDASTPQCPECGQRLDPAESTSSTSGIVRE